MRSLETVVALSVPAIEARSLGGQGRCAGMGDLIVVGPQERDREAARVGSPGAMRLFGPRPRRNRRGSGPSSSTSWQLCPRTASSGRKIARRCSLRSWPSGAGFRGQALRRVLACQVKPTSRAIQRDAVPEATPRFAPLDGPPPFPGPVVREAGRRPSLAGGEARHGRGGARLDRGGAALPGRLRAARRARRPAAGIGTRLPRRGGGHGRRGDARGLRPRGPDDGRRRH